MNNHMRNQLRIGIGVENRSVELQFFSELLRIDQRTVMSQRHGSFDVADNQRLRVCPCRDFGSVQNVTNSDSSAAQLVEYVLGENIGNQSQIAVRTDNSVIVYGDSAALLSSVLQSVQSHIGIAHNTRAVFFGINAKDATFLMNLVKHEKSPFVLKLPLL